MNQIGGQEAYWAVPVRVSPTMLKDTSFTNLHLNMSFELREKEGLLKWILKYGRMIFLFSTP